MGAAGSLLSPGLISFESLWTHGEGDAPVPLTFLSKNDAHIHGTRLLTKQLQNGARIHVAAEEADGERMSEPVGTPGSRRRARAWCDSHDRSILPNRVDKVRHHFGDALDREGGFWTIVPNRERYSYRIGDVPEGSPEITIVTLGKGDHRWEHVRTLPHLEELTLHEPSPAQLAGLGALSSLKRLRITHARPKDIEFIGAMAGVEELVLEYVSGFADLSPLRHLTRLRALHLENLRRVSQFGGLSGIPSLRYLSIHGTLDWKQPISDFEFLRGLAGLEVLAMFQVITKAAYPALLPALSLRKLERLRVAGSYFDTAEYALLEEGLPGVEGASWGPYRSIAHRYIKLPRDDVRARLPDDVIRANHPEVILRYDGGREIADPSSIWFEFTGKGAGRVKCNSSAAEAKCRVQAARYSEMKEAARALIERSQREPSPSSPR